MKAPAPPPPSAPQPAPRKVIRNAIPDGGAAADTKENVVKSTVDLELMLPDGYRTEVTMDGRKALMDVLVDLCAQYHLNPAEHTLELAPAEGRLISFKPNTVLGTLNATRALIKERTLDKRVPRKPAPKVPEQEEPAAPKHTRSKKTVRLVVNYHHGQKTVVRVNPLVPLQSLVPAICQKCEFNPARVLLLRDAVSQHELDLGKSLAELEIRELYVFDQTLVLHPKMVSAPVLYHSETVNSDSQRTIGGEKKGLLGLFSFNRRKSKNEEFSDDMDQHDSRIMQYTRTNNGPSLVSNMCVETRPNTLGQSQSAMNLSRLSPKTEPKKRRAPAPPPTSHTLVQTQTQYSSDPVAQTNLSSENQLKKRKAPPPPPIVHPTTTSTPSLSLDTTQVPSVQVVSDDSMSDLSHSIEDSEPAASICSSSSNDDATESSSLAEETMAEPATELKSGFTSKVEPRPELSQQPACKSFVQQEPEDMASALELKTEEVENNRHSAMVWVRRTEQEVETVSMCSSESLADQGYAASEGMADSPSTSPEDAVSLGPDSSARTSQPREDCDSDEGCATWGSHHSGNMRPGDKSVKRNDGYEEDPELAAQIHLTLADLDAELADEVNHSDEASVCVDDDIPVSVVDLDVPVTKIDEVTDYNLSSLSANEAALSYSNQNGLDGSKQLSVDLQNKNNNACMSKQASISPSQADHIQSGNTKVQIEKVTLSPGIKGRVDPEKKKLPETSQKTSPVMSTITHSAQNVPESRFWPPPTLQIHGKENTELDRASPGKAQNLISQSPVSRFGLKTFTIIPSKPVGPQNHVKTDGSLGMGAIKIDELGNMVSPREAQDKANPLDDPTDDRDSPLLDKAKAFWSSTEKEDSVPVAHKRPSVKIAETKAGEVVKSLENPKPLPVTVTSQPTEKLIVREPPKQMGGSSINLASAVMKKLAVTDPAENIFFSKHRKNLNLLKPTRNTSSHYVASAITTYTENSSCKVLEVQKLPEAMPAGHTQLPSQAFKNGLRPVQATSNHKVSGASANYVPFIVGAKPYPNCTAEKQEDFRRPQVISTNESGTKALNTILVNPKLQQAYSEPNLSSTNEDTSIKKALGNPLPPKSTRNMTRPAIAKKPELHSLGLQPSLFGPVKTFKPVVLKSVEKDSCLHSSLMEAIQSGEGLERLKKVSRMGTLKKPDADPENERCALLSAIRAESNSTRLKKTRSSAAAELERFRNSEENKAIRNHTSPLTPPPKQILAFTPPPPPPPPPPPTFTAPPPPNFTPPPAPILPLNKSTVVLPAGGNPEFAREALLEAIRSGAGAQQLRKVPVSTKTLKVNGRLGIIQPSASRPHKP